MKPKAKKAKSKRISCRQRYKVERKVREHHRKLRREGKDPRLDGLSKLKKDPGVPNLHPFKEDLLKSAEATRERIRVEKERQREERRKQADKLRHVSTLELLQKEAERRGREFDRQGGDAEEGGGGGAAAVGGVSENSRRAYYKEFKKVVDAADVVLEVLDARDPLACRCARVEQAVLASGGRKRLVLVLNKIDLVPREVVEGWLVYLRKEFPTIAFKASTQSQKEHLSHRSDSLSAEGGACKGAGTLLKLLGNYCRNRNIKTGIRVGIVGFPNVGKSSIINSLKRSRACAVAPTPGFTKTVQEVVLDKHVKLLDSPGIVFAKNVSEEELVLRNVVKLDSLQDPLGPVDAILRRCDHEQLMERYVIPKFETTVEFLQHLARRHGRLKKGGVPDNEGAARILLQDWIDGRLSYYTVPPEEHKMPTHLSSEVVGELAQEFDIAALLKEESEVLATLPSAKDCTKMVSMKSGEMAEAGDDPMEGEEEDEEEGGEGEEEEEEEEEEEGMDEGEEGEDVLDMEDEEEEDVLDMEDDEEEEEGEAAAAGGKKEQGAPKARLGAASGLESIKTAVAPRPGPAAQAAPRARVLYEESSGNSLQRNKQNKKNFKQMKRQARRAAEMGEGDDGIGSASYDFSTDFVDAEEA